MNSTILKAEIDALGSKLDKFANSTSEADRTLLLRAISPAGAEIVLQMTAFDPESATKSNPPKPSEAFANACFPGAASGHDERRRRPSGQSFH